MGYIVRTAAEDDMPRILEIEREAISPPWPHGALLAELYREDSLFLAAIGSGEAAIGFCILRRMADEGELLQIAVDKTHRKHGAADALMHGALIWAGEQGLLSMFLEVRLSAVAAISLYEKHGFESVRVRKGYYTHPAEDAMVMTRRMQIKVQT